MINRFARRTGFICRSSKLSGYHLLSVLVTNSFSDKELSLNDLCQDLFEHYGVRVTKQGLDQRFSSPAALFFKSVLENILTRLFSDTIRYRLPCRSFKAVKIKDSTAFQLPEAYCETYPGSGGSGSEAALRIQFEYDLLTGRISDLSVHPFNDQDLNNARDTLSDIGPGELIVRDLGYMTSDIPPAIDQQKAFYISKLPTSITNLFIKDNKDQIIKLDLEDLLRKMGKNDFNRISYNSAYLGTEKYPIRLLIEKVPDELYEQRLRKAEQWACKKGRKLSKVKKIKMRFNIFITNVAEQDLSQEAIQQIYRLRWQIELVFKTWKSFAKVHQIKPMKQIRFECMLLVNLMCLTIQNKFLWIFTLNSLFHNKKLSLMKLSKSLIKRVKKIWSYSAMGFKQINKYINKLIELTDSYCEFEKKKGKLSSYEIMEEYMLINCQPVGYDK